MFKFNKSYQCPFYEEHAGEYYQGCWEFNDLCYLAPLVYEADGERRREVLLNSKPECAFGGCSVFNEYEGIIFEFVKLRCNTHSEKVNSLWALRSAISYFNKNHKCRYYE